MPPIRALLLVIPLLGVGVGCEALSHLGTSLRPDTAGTDDAIEPVDRTEPRMYPADADLGEPLEIELVRLDRTRVRLENRTARRIEGGQLWVNQEFGGQLTSLGVGARATIALDRFVNHRGEMFPTGSLLEPEKTNTIVLADLYLDGKLHKLVVRLPEGWQDARPLGA